MAMAHVAAREPEEKSAASRAPLPSRAGAGLAGELGTSKYSHTYIYTYTYTYICVCKYTYIYMCICMNVLQT